jgi:hypothetical protein
MGTRSDPLRKGPVPDRVFYATGALLDADDFTAEQTYHRARLARVLAYLHGSGTVAGLRVVHQPGIAAGADPALAEGREERLMVEPGLAVDPIGRLIEIPRAGCIRLGRWYQQQDAEQLSSAVHTLTADDTSLTGVVADVYARFVPCERGKTPAFVAGPFAALDAVAPSRVRDEYALDLVLRDEDTPPEPTRILDLPDDDEDEARTQLHEAILDAWREGTDEEGDAEISLLHAHAAGQDPTSVFLARLVIETEEGEPAAGDPPARVAERTVSVMNTMRPFVYTGGSLSRWMGI